MLIREAATEDWPRIWLIFQQIVKAQETYAFDPDIRLVHAPGHAEGLAASLRTGVAALPAATRAAFVFLGDMPRVPSLALGSGCVAGAVVAM